MVMWCSSLRIREVSRGWQQLGEFMPTTVSRNHRAEITSSRDEGEKNNGGHLRLVNMAAYCITSHFLQLLDRIGPPGMMEWPRARARIHPRPILRLENNLCFPHGELIISAPTPCSRIAARDRSSASYALFFARAPR